MMTPSSWGLTPYNTGDTLVLGLESLAGACKPLFGPSLYTTRGGPLLFHEGNKVGTHASEGPWNSLIHEADSMILAMHEEFFPWEKIDYVSNLALASIRSHAYLSHCRILYGIMVNYLLITSKCTYHCEYQLKFYWTKQILQLQWLPTTPSHQCWRTLSPQSNEHIYSCMTIWCRTRSECESIDSSLRTTYKHNKSQAIIVRNW